MAWNISAGAIRKPIPPILLMLTLLFAGWTAFVRLPINQLPNVEMGGFTVVVAQPGASPSEMETQVTQRVEAALSSVQGVKGVDSTISPGLSTTSVEMETSNDLARAVEDARSALQTIRADLPPDIQEPQIQRDETASQPIGLYAVEGKDMSAQDISWFIDNDLQRELLAVPGISAVTRSGGVDRAIRLDLDPAAMLRHKVTADQISDELRATNADLPGGQSKIGEQAQSIRTLGGAQSMEELADLRVTNGDGFPVRLSDLGTITDAASDQTSISRYNGQEVISISVQRARGASEIQVFDAMEKRFRDIEAAHPGIKITQIVSNVEVTRGMYESSIHALIEGAVLACIVILLILRDWRATLIAAAAIPLSILPTFAGMELLGFTLNMITLIALALVTGVLVDDAIVEIENIVRHMRMGKAPYEAALEAADEIGLAVVATTGAIIAVFLPVSLMGSGIGIFFREFGLTVAIAAFFSLVVARLITPLMAAFLLKSDGHAKEVKLGFITQSYSKALSWTIQNPWKTIAMGIAIFAGSLGLATIVPATFFPRMDNSAVQVRVEIPPGTPLLQADRALRDMSARIEAFPEVVGVFASLDGSDGSAGEASLEVQLTKRNQRKRSAYDIEQEIRPMLAQFPGYRVSFIQDNGASQGADITVLFVGNDPKAVNQSAENLAKVMGQMESLVDVRSGAALRRPEIQIRPRQIDMARLGVSTQNLAGAIRVATSGDSDQNLPKFSLLDRQIPIRVAVRPELRDDLDALRSLLVPTQRGGLVRIDAVADINFSFGESAIIRRDRERAVSVEANLSAGTALSKAQAEVFGLPEAIGMPGARLAKGGQSEDFSDMTASFGNAMLWGVLLIYILLVLLFSDFFQPITIMMALPLSIGGAFVGLLVSGQPLSLFAFIGLLMLMGLVTKNSILLVDFAVEQMRAGVSRDEALFQAGLKRARPIIMTTFAMCGGMVPAALGWGVDGAMRQGMGAAVIGGMLFSTLLSLVFVPAMFILIDRLERRVHALLPALRKPAPVAPVEIRTQLRETDLS